jgi:hypothetical protein
MQEPTRRRKRRMRVNQMNERMQIKKCLEEFEPMSYHYINAVPINLNEKWASFYAKCKRGWEIVREGGTVLIEGKLKRTHRDEQGRCLMREHTRPDLCALWYQGMQPWIEEFCDSENPQSPKAREKIRDYPFSVNFVKVKEL